MIGIHSASRWISRFKDVRTAGSPSAAWDWSEHCFNHYPAWPIVALNLSRVSSDRLLGKENNLLTSFTPKKWVKIIFNSVIALTVHQPHCWAHTHSERAPCVEVLWQRASQRRTDSTPHSWGSERLISKPIPHLSEHICLWLEAYSYRCISVNKTHLSPLLDYSFAVVYGSRAPEPALGSWVTFCGDKQTPQQRGMGLLECKPPSCHTSPSAQPAYSSCLIIPTHRGCAHAYISRASRVSQYVTFFGGSLALEPNMYSFQDIFKTNQIRAETELHSHMEGLHRWRTDGDATVHSIHCEGRTVIHIDVHSLFWKLSSKNQGF